ncbi:MAG: trigger factor [Deltaproteobacteria bacterium]|nr:trigger factor [Deltaproteobacteria bacterium]
MKVDVEDVSTVKKIMHVEIPEKDVTRELDKAYKTLKTNAKIKGFRPGKVPLSLLEKRFKKEMHEEVSGQLIQNSYGEALGQAELVPLGEPAIDRPDLEKGQPYRYSATIEVRPPVGGLDLNGLKLKEKVHVIDDVETETQLKMLQKRNAQLKSVDEDRPVRDKDVVIIDYEGFKDGKPLEPARKTENFQVEIGSGRILEDFDKQLVGMKPDSTKELQVRFPDDYYNKDLAGLEVTFKVTLKEIKEEILPELDDEFAKDLGEYETLDELKEAIRKDLEQRYKAESRRQLREDIIDKLIEQSDFELPEALVKGELAGVVRDAQSLMAQRGMSLEQSGQTEEELSEKYLPMAERKVREYLLIEKVIDQEEITLTDELLDEAYEEFAGALNQPVDTIKEFHNSSQEAFDVFKQRTLEKQAIKHIIDMCDVERIEEGDS